MRLSNGGGGGFGLTFGDTLSSTVCSGNPSGCFMGDGSFVRSTPLGFGSAGVAASTRVGLTDRKASLGVFGAVFGGVLGGSIPIAFGTGAGAFAASLFGASLADVVFATSFAGVLGFSAGFFGGVFGATGIAFFFGGGGMGPFGGVFGGGTGGGRFGAASLGRARLLRGSSASGRI